MLPDPPSGSRLQHLRAPPTYITPATAVRIEHFCSKSKTKEVKAVIHARYNSITKHKNVFWSHWGFIGKDWKRLQINLYQVKTNIQFKYKFTGTLSWIRESDWLYYSADSLQLWIANEHRLFWTRDACFTPQCTSCAAFETFELPM